MKKICVYLHKTKVGDVFYVGIGSLKRAYNFSTRNLYWKRKSAKHGCSVEIIHSNLNRKEACSWERYYIFMYKQLGVALCNLTEGGEGRTNLHNSDKQKKAVALSNSIRTITDKTKKLLSELKKKPVLCVETNIIYNSLSKAAEETGARQSHISSVCHGRRNKAGGFSWKFVGGVA